MGRVTERVPVVRLTGLGTESLRVVRRPDAVAVEEPLEVRVGGQVLTVTMRTPGADLELAHGYLLAEGVITRRADVASARYCAGAVAQGPDGAVANTYNVLEIDLVNPSALVLDTVSRSVFTSSSCGVCGTSSIEAIAARVPPAGTANVARISPHQLPGMLDTLRVAQPVFAQTGGLHAAGLFRLDGGLIATAEDVGRHNAVDKVIGAALLAEQLPLHDAALLVSSRASFEIIQKAAVAGIPIVIAVSAPSSLAVATARSLGMTLIGFARGERANVYTGAERIVSPGAPGDRRRPPATTTPSDAG